MEEHVAGDSRTQAGVSKGENELDWYTELTNHALSSQRKLQDCIDLGMGSLVCTSFEKWVLGVFQKMPFTLNSLAFALLDDYDPGAEAKKKKSHVVDSLIGAYTMLALVSALLLSMAIAPFIQLGNKEWEADQYYVYSLMVISCVLLMMTSMFSLLVIIACVTFLSGLDPVHAHVVVATFPFFGTPFINFIVSVMLCLVYAFCSIKLQLPDNWYCYGMLIAALLGLIAYAGTVKLCSRVGKRLLDAKHANEDSEDAKHEARDEATNLTRNTERQLTPRAVANRKRTQIHPEPGPVTSSQASPVVVLSSESPSARYTATGTGSLSSARQQFRPLA